MNKKVRELLTKLETLRDVDMVQQWFKDNLTEVNAQYFIDEAVIATAKDTITLENHIKQRMHYSAADKISEFSTITHEKVEDREGKIMYPVRKYKLKLHVLKDE